MFTAAGKSAAVSAANYIEDVFSTWLYTGNGSTQTITNGIDLSGKGGLVWVKRRNDLGNNGLIDTARGRDKVLFSDATAAQQTSPTSGDDLTSFNSNGFSVGASYNVSININGGTYASWTFREQAKFFDVVTYTGNGSNRTIAHNLGSVPGCIIIKRTDSAANWQVYHRSLANTEYLVLNSNNPKATGTTRWNSTTPTSTEFSLGTDATVNANSGTYVAYLFAHDAGGFGATGSDNVITCGSYVGNASSSGPTITLGYEPQWLLIKNTGSAENWSIFDNMRGLPVGNGDLVLRPNTSDAEVSGGFVSINATGFQLTTTDATYNNNGDTFIYIAIRRGPMKTPTSGTSVFTPDAAGNNASAGGLAFDAGFPVDWYVRGEKSGSSKFYGFSRLTGNEYLTTTSTAAGATTTYADQFDSMTGIETTTGFDFTGQCAWLFRRAPGFFDVVCYTGNGSARTISHNLGVAPEMMIMKARTVGSAGPYNWIVYHTALSAGGFIYLNLTNAGTFSGNTSFWNGIAPTSSVFSLGGASGINENTYTYVAYLFASVTGVSKVGSYTGTGALQTINCGFAAGARFVLIKRTDSTGDWYVYDSARGITSGNDPYLFLNSTAAEVTNTNYVDTTSVGFQVTAAAPAGLNANGGTYIFLAIA